MDHWEKGKGVGEFFSPCAYNNCIPIPKFRLLLLRDTSCRDQKDVWTGTTSTEDNKEWPRVSVQAWQWFLRLTLPITRHWHHTIPRGIRSRSIFQRRFRPSNKIPSGHPVSLLFTFVYLVVVVISQVDSYSFNLFLLILMASSIRSGTPLRGQARKIVYNVANYLGNQKELHNLK